MNNIALSGSNGPVFGTALSALLHAGFAVSAFVSHPTRLMLRSPGLSANRLNIVSSADFARQLAAFDTLVLAYETDLRNRDNNDFILRTYSTAVNGALSAGLRRLVVIGNPYSEAFFVSEFSRREGRIDASFISTEGDYADRLVAAVSIPWYF